MSTTKQNTWKSNGNANDTADYQPPQMHVGDDGAQVVTHSVRAGGHEVCQITYAVDGLTDDDIRRIHDLLQSLQ